MLKVEGTRADLVTDDQSNQQPFHRLRQARLHSLLFVNRNLSVTSLSQDTVSLKSADVDQHGDSK